MNDFFWTVIKTNKDYLFILNCKHVPLKDKISMGLMLLVGDLIALSILYLYIKFMMWLLKGYGTLFDIVEEVINDKLQK